MGSIECGLFTSEYNYQYTDDYDARHINRNHIYCEPFKTDAVLNPKSYEPHIAATLNRFTAVEKALDLMKPNLTMRIGGSGNKCLYILDNQAEYLIHTVKSMKYWDTCAVEALVRGRFGVVTDKEKRPIIYKASEKDKFTISNGLIIARNQSVYDLCYGRADEYLRELKVERGIPV